MLKCIDKSSRCTSKVLVKSAICPLGRSDLSLPPAPPLGTVQVLVASDDGALAIVIRPPVTKYNQLRDVMEPCD